MADHGWKPAAPLPRGGGESAAQQRLFARWRDAQTHLQTSEPDELRAIKVRLIRRLFAEMGLLENLYELDRASTEAMVANGFAAENVRPSGSNMEPARLATMLRNQELAVAALPDKPEVAPLAISDIQRMHTVMMQHQDSVAATDASGQKILVPLLKGVFKTASNDLRLADGSLHGFCPPDRVAPELARIIDVAASAGSEDPVVVAAWLHSALYELHPFQTGNGRVVRGATTHFMLAAGLLPIVVEREDRTTYKAAMATAARGDIAPLVALFQRAEAAAIGRALTEAGIGTSTDHDNHKQTIGRIQ